MPTYRGCDENSTQPNVNYWTYEHRGITYYVDENDISKWKAWFEDNITGTEICCVIVLLSVAFMTGIFWLMHYCSLKKAYNSSLRVYTIAGKPHLPIETEDLDEFKEYDFRRTELPEPRVYVGGYQKYRLDYHLESVDVVSHIVRYLLKIERPLVREKTVANKILWHRWLYPIPRNSKVVAVAMPGFMYGRECYHFHPIRGAKITSHCSYQMLGRSRCIVTRYHENERVFVAGFCLFIRNPYEHTANWPVKAIFDLCKSSDFEEYSRKLKNYEENRHRLRLEQQSALKKEPEEVVVTVVDEVGAETPIFESKSIGSSLNLDPPNLGYTESPEDEIEENPSMTPESLRGNIVPLASSEESSLLGSEVDKVSLSKRIQKDGYIRVESEDVEKVKDDDNVES